MIIGKKKYHVNTYIYSLQIGPIYFNPCNWQRSSVQKIDFLKFYKLKKKQKINEPTLNRWETLNGQQAYEKIRMSLVTRTMKANTSKKGGLVEMYLAQSVNRISFPIEGMNPTDDDVWNSNWQGLGKTQTLLMEECHKFIKRLWRTVGQWWWGLSCRMPKTQPFHKV